MGSRCVRDLESASVSPSRSAIASVPLLAVEPGGVGGKFTTGNLITFEGDSGDCGGVILATADDLRRGVGADGVFKLLSRFIVAGASVLIEAVLFRALGFLCLFCNPSSGICGDATSSSNSGAASVSEFGVSCKPLKSFGRLTLRPHLVILEDGVFCA